MNWQITKLEVKPLLDGLSDVVIAASWTVSEADESFSGVTLLSPPSGDFTPYGSLTQDQVLGWVWQKVSKEGTEEIVSTRLQEKQSPSTIDPPLPWG